MLKLLRIENFALIEMLELQFAAGLNVLTGETGAGKSIILDALDAALGGSVSAKSIRTGSRKALIEAVFTLSPPLVEWLQEQEIDPIDEGLVCSREIGERTSRSRVNGILINKQQIQNLRTRLVEITAQGQTIQLQDPGKQRRWLDAYATAVPSNGRSSLISVRQAVQQAYQTWHKAKTRLETHRQDQQHRLQRLDILEFQAKELEAAKLGKADELETLTKDRDRLAYSVELQKQSYQIYQLLYQNEAERSTASDLLGQSEQLLEDMCEVDPDLQSILEMIRSALIQTEEAAQQLYQYGEELETDPGRLNKIERRLVLLKQLCRKYGPTLADVIRHAETVMDELDRLKHHEGNLEALDAEVQAAQKELKKHCDQLTQLRQQAAMKLEKVLITELEPLGMSGVRFSVQIEPTTITAEGQDQITFLFSPNPGEPLQPLAATASGGEMSRFLLGMKTVFSQADPVATMVFDEIDAGVSGRMAQAIATKLHMIASHHQVLCVTHQPLVAAMADHHIRVRKVVRKKRTVVQVDPLSDLERRDELAQLTAGHSAQEAITFVEALLAQAASLRSHDLSESLATHPETRTKG